MTFIELTDDQHVDNFLKELNKTEKEIECLMAQLKRKIDFYNSRGNAVHKLTNKYKVPTYKITLIIK